MCNVESIMKIQLRFASKIILGCFAALFAVTSALNVCGSVRCVEEGGSVRMELVCNPCCLADNGECSSGDISVVDNDHVGCDNCLDFPAGELARAQRPSSKLVSEALTITNSPVLVASDVGIWRAGGYSLGPPVVRGRPEYARALLEATVLRC